MKALLPSLMWLILLTCVSQQTRAQTPEEDQKLRSLIKQAMQYRANNMPREQAQMLEQALPLLSRIVGANHEQTVGMMNDLGNLYHDLGQYAKAEPLYQRCLKIRETTLGKDHTKTGRILNNLALLYDAQGQYAKSEPVYLRCLAIFEAHKEMKETATVLNNLAGLYSTQGRLDKAEELARRALTLRETHQGRNDSSVAFSLNTLGLIYLEKGQHDKAEPLLERCVKLCETHFGREDHRTASAVDNLANLYMAQGEYAKAEPLYRRSLATREKVLGKDSPSTATSLNNLAEWHRTLGQFAAAESLNLRNLAICEAALGPNHPDTARALDNLGVLYQIQGMYAKAEPLYRRCLAIRETHLGKDHPSTATTLNNLASLARAQGQNEKAEQLFRRNLEICEAKLGPKHPDTGRALDNLATLYHELGQHARAEPLYQRGLEIREERLGKDHPDVALTLNNLACLHRAQAEYVKAEAMFERCLAICTGKLGEQHPRTAATLNNLATLYHAQRKYDQAEPLFRRAQVICAARLGANHPHTAIAWHNLASVALQTQRWQAAVEYSDHARRSLTRHTATVLPALAEPEQLLFLQTNESIYHRALSLGLLRGQDQDSAEVSAAWLINGRALSHQTLAEQHLLARDAANSRARALLEQVQQTRGALAALLHRTPPAGQENAFKVRREELQQQEQEQARKLALELGRPFRAEPWIELAEVRKQLGAKTVLIDIARFPVSDFQKEEFPVAHYAAWITPPAGQGKVTVVNLGKAEPIERAVHAARQAITQSADNIKKTGETEATKAALKPLQGLAQLVLHPLHEAIKEYPEWIICPDGALCLAPWSALPLPDGKYAVEKHLIRHVISGRDLVQPAAATRSKDAWLFGDPDFDLSPGKVTAQIAPVLRTLAEAGPSPLLGQRLQGEIRGYRVSFEFLTGGQLVVYDEVQGGKELLRGQWRQIGEQLFLETTRWRYVGTRQGNTMRGQRQPIQPTGNAVKEDWHCTLSPEVLRLMRSDDLRSVGTAGRLLPRVARLPFSGQEVEAVRPRVAALLGVEPKLHIEGAASETLVKLARRPRLLMLSTHGYFLPDQEIRHTDPGRLLDEREQSSKAVLDKKGERIENPLLRCGLLLAGCNQRGAVQLGDEDGVLTGLEIVGQDLRGCELVVLSACETGIGEVRNGEGVVGLRQAFQLAGAESVLASLWQVSDRETALLMNEFFNAWSEGRTRAEALRQAQLRRLEVRRRQFGEAHPFYWAAFTFTGK